MAKVDLIMPKMGESIMEATILGWLKQVGDPIALDETVLEIATDKVDSEIPSPVEGVLSEILFEKDAVVAVGSVIARIETEGQGNSDQSKQEHKPEAPEPTQTVVQENPTKETKVQQQQPSVKSSSDRFYSPLVKTIAKAEGISQDQLDLIPGTGKSGRVTKKDILGYINNGNSSKQAHVETTSPTPVSDIANTPVSSGANVEIIEMDRMRKLIADHMVMSKKTSPHVTSFVEVDVTNMVNWRNANKQEFQKKHGEKITFTPLIMDAVVRALIDFPMVNVSVDGNNIIRKKDINVGMATALPSGNLIVPVIKNADRLSMLGLAKSVNDLASRARANKLKPSDIQDGTFTLTNVGTFGNVMGTPIINQPQVAIMAAGAIRKKPAVLETEYGDVIAVRQMMFLSLSYDHRVVDGFLGGSFLRRVGDYLEAFDASQTI